MRSQLLLSLVLVLLLTTLATSQHVREVSDAGLTLRLVFTDDVEPWQDSQIKPFVQGAERWPEVVKGVPGRSWVLEIEHILDPNIESPGADLTEVVKVATGVYLPTRGTVEMSPREFTNPDDDPVEIAIHEYGHVFGIGPLWSLSRDDGQLLPDEAGRGRVRDLYKREAAGWILHGTHAVREYNKVFSTNFDFVPVNPDGHPFTIEGRFGQRKTSNGKTVPPIEEDCMGHGSALSRITLGMLHDLGWEVDYSRADPYPTRR